MWRLLGVALPAILAACTVLEADPYPLPIGPPHSAQATPQRVGVAAQAVVLYLTARPGDEIELLGAEPIGVAEGATVQFYFSPQVHEGDGTDVIGELLEPLAGAVFSNETTSTGPESTIGIVAEITTEEPGRYRLSAVRLRYRLNGGQEEVGEGIDVVFTVCADDPAPSSCEDALP